MAVELLVEGQVLPDVRLVVFDKDGTLMDVHAYWANMVRFRAETLRDRLNLDRDTMLGLMDSMGVDVRRMRIKPDGPVGLKEREVVLQAGVDYLVAAGRPDSTDVFVDAFREVDRMSLDHFDEIARPIDGLYPLVAALGAGGCKIAVATTDRTDRAALAMEHLGISDAVDVIVGADLIETPKPDPEIIHVICGRLGVSPGRSVMVGDSASDVQTGLNAGCLASIGVTSGLTPPEALSLLTSLVVSDLSAITVQSQAGEGDERTQVAQGEAQPR